MQSRAVQRAWINWSATEMPLTAYRGVLILRRCKLAPYLPRHLACADAVEFIFLCFCEVFDLEFGE